MKKQFAEYYELPEERIKEIWDNSLIVFDTNVLLNLYRYNEESRNEFINVIKTYKERLWIPYQVGLEFHRRRETVIRKHISTYKSLGEDVSKRLMDVVTALRNNGDYIRHPYIKIADIESKLKRCAISIKKSLDEQESKHPDYLKVDSILSAITELFDGCVGNDYAVNELEELYKEGEKRYANQVPPGYCDEKNKKDKPKRHLYGDLIVWKQTITQSKEQKRDVIFITDDHKPDWWDKVDGKHSPRKELIREFIDNTGQNVLIYDSGRFLEYAKRNKAKVSPKTIREVEKVKQEDIETTQRNRRAHYGNIFSGIDFDAINEFAKRLGHYSTSIKRMQEQISSSIAIPTINPITLIEMPQKDEIIEEFEQQRERIAQIIEPRNNDIEGEK